MTELERLLRQGTEPPDLDQQWQPLLFDRCDEEQRDALDELVRSGAIEFLHDTISQQLGELLETREPSRDYTGEELADHVARHLAGVPVVDYGIWAFYPWSRRLVHVLPEPEYRELRTDRNRYLILPEEQEQLRRFTIGIAGLSVGRSTALLLAMEGVGGCFRLADFDIVALPNMSRMQTSVHCMGLNKAVLAARDMLQIDPYLDIDVYRDGITDGNINHFLHGNGKLALLIEECDDLFTKVRLRERARELGIPVLMETSERGLIDIERFDREPARPLFHGLAGQLDAASLKGLTTKEKVPLALRIIGEQTMSERAKATLVEIGETTTSFPAVASGVALGGAVATHVARRILLGELQSSGRFYVDVADIIRDGRGIDLPSSEIAGEEVDAPPDAVVAGPSPRGARRSVSSDEVRWIVHHGTLAPSGGNCQPWRFSWRKGRLSCWHVASRSESLLDYGNTASHLAFGAAIENMQLAVAALGRGSMVDVFPDRERDDLVCRLELTTTRSAASHGSVEHVAARHTNRQLGPREPLRRQDATTLDAAAESAGGEIAWVVDDDSLREAARILGRGDRLRMLSKVMHREMMAELRWSPAEAGRTRDGIDVATLEMSPADLAGMRVISSWPAMKVLGKIGGGRALEKPAHQAMAGASALGLLTVPGTGRTSYVQGGRAMQRVWLSATRLGLAFQPMTAITYLFGRLEQGRGQGLSQAEVRELAELRKHYARLFEVRPDRSEALLFRVARARPPSARALRRGVDDVLSFE